MSSYPPVFCRAVSKIYHSDSFTLSNGGGPRSRGGGLSVSLAGPDGRVLGGGVAGVLIAASPVQV